jgi:hypothetical protein
MRHSQCELSLTLCETGGTLTAGLVSALTTTR